MIVTQGMRYNINAAKYGDDVDNWKSKYCLQPFLDMHMSTESACTKWT